MSDTEKTPVDAFVGQTLRGTINLRLEDLCKGLSGPYALPDNALIQILFPGVADSVVIEVDRVADSDDSGEVVVVDDQESKITYKLGHTKSLLLKPTSEKNGVKEYAAVNVKVTNLDDDEEVDIFQQVKVYNIMVQKNPDPA